MAIYISVLSQIMYTIPETHFFIFLFSLARTNIQIMTSPHVCDCRCEAFFAGILVKLLGSPEDDSTS